MKLMKTKLLAGLVSVLLATTTNAIASGKAPVYLEDNYSELSDADNNKALHEQLQFQLKEAATSAKAVVSALEADKHSEANAPWVKSQEAIQDVTTIVNVLFELKKKADAASSGGGKITGKEAYWSYKPSGENPKSISRDDYVKSGLPENLIDALLAEAEPLTVEGLLQTIDKSNSAVIQALESDLGLIVLEDMDDINKKETLKNTQLRKQIDAEKPKDKSESEAAFKAFYNTTITSTDQLSNLNDIYLTNMKMIKMLTEGSVKMSKQGVSTKPVKDPAGGKPKLVSFIKDWDGKASELSFFVNNTATKDKSKSIETLEVVTKTEYEKVQNVSKRLRIADSKQKAVIASLEAKVEAFSQLMMQYDVEVEKTSKNIPINLDLSKALAAAGGATHKTPNVDVPPKRKAGGKKPADPTSEVLPGGEPEVPLMSEGHSSTVPHKKDVQPQPQFHHDPADSEDEEPSIDFSKGFTAFKFEDN